MKRTLHTRFFLFFALLVCTQACAHRAYEIDRAKSLYQEGQIFLTQERPVQALQKFSESLTICREEGYDQGVAHNLNEIGILLTGNGEHVEAREKFKEALVVYRQLDMNPEVSKSLNNIALSHVLEKDHPEAVPFYEELIHWDKKAGNRLGVAITHHNLGSLYARYLNQPEKASEHYEKAFVIFQSLGDTKRAEAVKAHMDALDKEKNTP